MPFTFTEFKEFFTKVYTDPSIKEIIAEDIKQSRMDVIQCKLHVETYQFMQHMAEAKLTALWAWERKNSLPAPYKSHPTTGRKQHDSR